MLFCSCALGITFCIPIRVVLEAMRFCPCALCTENLEKIALV